MSSTVVRSNQPPHSSRALILQTPAVPLKPKKLINTPLTCCSTSKWNDKFIFCNLVSRFSSLFTNAHLVWTNARSSFPYKKKKKEKKKEKRKENCSWIIRTCRSPLSV
jgi:hypothetical protein